jgi:pyruvate kinase
VLTNTVIEIRPDGLLGDTSSIPLYPKTTVSKLAPCVLVCLDFNAVLVQVLSVGEELVTGRVLNGGEIGNNKAVTVNRSIELEPLTDKDQNAITLGKQLGINHFALSFANTGSDVDLIRSLTGKNAFIISKVESRQALLNLDEIIELSDAILIDRGDLSREVAIEVIPIVQRQVINRARLKKRSVYVATNLLESMITSPGPTRAEVNDVYSTLEQGASGLVLAAETAIGEHPVASAARTRPDAPCSSVEYTSFTSARVGPGEVIIDSSRLVATYTLRFFKRARLITCLCTMGITSIATSRDRSPRSIRMASDNSIISSRFSKACLLSTLEIMKAFFPVKLRIRSTSLPVFANDRAK